MVDERHLTNGMRPDNDYGEWLMTRHMKVARPSVKH